MAGIELPSTTQISKLSDQKTPFGDVFSDFTLKRELSLVPSNGMGMIDDVCNRISQLEILSQHFRNKLDYTAPVKVVKIESKVVYGFDYPAEEQMYQFPENSTSRTPSITDSGNVSVYSPRNADEASGRSTLNISSNCSPAPATASKDDFYFLTFFF